MERPILDPVLILGWIMTAWMGGALEQRPIVFTTGGHGAGKTTLQNIIRELFRHVAFASANTTAAGVYQNLGRDSRPVLIDELEAKPGDARATAIIELARIAYSGDSLDRGGSDHVGTSFTARSAFFLSAILHPPLHVQDRSRMAVLNLSRLDRTDRNRKLDKPLDVRESDGRMLLRQVMDGWTDFSVRLLPKWKVALVRAGLSDRLADTYGTLLAAAELAIGPEALREAGLPVYDEEALGAIIVEATAGERAEQVDTWVECVTLLLSSQVDVWKAGEKPTVGGILEELRETQAFASEARARLATAGLGLVEPGRVCSGWGLAVPPSGPLLDRVFADTKFAKGGWFQALKQGDPKIVLRGEALRRPKLGTDGIQEMDEQRRPKCVDGSVVKINGVAQRCVVVDVEAFE